MITMSTVEQIKKNQTNEEKKRKRSFALNWSSNRTAVPMICIAPDRLHTAAVVDSLILGCTSEKWGLTKSTVKAQQYLHQVK